MKSISSCIEPWEAASNFLSFSLYHRNLPQFIFTQTPYKRKHTVTGGGSVGECDKLSHPSWLLGVLEYSYTYLLKKMTRSDDDTG